MKKERFLGKAISKPLAIFLYTSFTFLIVMVLLANFFMNSYATLLNYAWGGIQLSAATKAAGMQLSEEIASEGVVLLKNELIDSNNASGERVLPLLDKNVASKQSAKVTLFGKTSVDFVYGGAGSAAIDTRNVIDLKTALENKGIQVNPTVWNAYTNAAKNYKGSVPPIIGPGDFSVNEVPYSEVQNAVEQSATAYNDYAIVVLGRNGGEGQDLPNSYLYLTDVEKTLLQAVCSNVNFKNIIVIVNANNSLQLRWLDDGQGKVVTEKISTVKGDGGIEWVENAPTVSTVQQILTMDAVAKIKGVVWAGSLGVTGLSGLAAVLAGEVSPSGRLADTWAYDVMSAPASNYIGQASYNDTSNLTDLQKNYTINHEGIFVGYRYYESRYYDTQQTDTAKQNNAKLMTKIQNATAWSYDDKELGVQYPFGYGLSYTTFTYALENAPVYDSAIQTITQQVKVTNTGGYPAKTTVQLYVQVPNQDSLTKGIEKSAIQLAGFTKTDIIQPNQSQTVTISVDVKDLRYYDKTGNGAFKIAEGKYLFTTGAINALNNVHNAIDEILAYNKGNSSGQSALNVQGLELNNSDVTSASMQNRIAKGANGVEIANKFTNGGTNTNNYGDINTYTSTAYDYATRTDWTTFSMNINGDSTTSIATIGALRDKNILQNDLTNTHARAVLRAQVSAIEPEWTKTPATFAKKTSATVLSSIGTAGYIATNKVDKAAALTELAQAMTYAESTRLVRMAGYATEQVNSIGLPKTEDKDGPSGITDTFFNNAKTGTAFPAQIVIAATGNVELAKRVGQQIAREAKEFKITGWYAPGVNLHRSALGGRNFEYYSEDSVLTSILGTSTVRNAVEGGVIIFLKHTAMNDIESNRLGLGVWADEQTMRELYYAPFEDAIVDGKCNGIMTSFTRIGTRWTGHSFEFMTQILREEWGFNGMTLTDYAGNKMFENYLDMEAGLLAGNNLWLNTVNTLYTDIEKQQNDALLSNALQNAVKNVIYTVGTSNAMHADMGLINKSGKVVENMLAWQVVLLIATVVLLVVAGAGIAYTTVRCIQRKC